VTETVFEEESASPATVSLPLSHLSLELGHLYMEDFVGGLPALTNLMRQVAPWARTVQEVVAAEVAPKPARISTCFLVDDYFWPVNAPAEVIPMLVEAAAAAGLTIDYLVRESACAQADGLDLSDLVLGRVVVDPPPGATGSRPAIMDSGWLCNGVRSPQPVESAQAMRTPVQWRPPAENGANRHSIFIDVELWSDPAEGRLWSCAFLAAVWQLLRLGLLRVHGEVVTRPVMWTDEFPAAWADLPPLVQLNPQARPFAAYRTFSVLASRFLPVEHAVRTILSQVAIEHAVVAQVLGRAADEGLVLPHEVVDRIEYVFAGHPWR
jgi:hypothetical protein